MPLRIRSTPALIGIRTTPGKMEMESPRPVVEMKTEHPKLELSSEHPQIQIDQTQAFAEAGNKTIGMLIDENSDRGKQAVMSSIAKTARQGRQLRDIQNKGNPIPSQAVENAFTQFNHEFGMVTIPRSGPQISLIRGRVNMNFKKGSINTNVRTQNVKYNYQKAKIEIYLRQKNSITVHYVDEKI